MNELLSVPDQMLGECGDFGRYQYVMLGAFAIVNFVSSIHYYSQTIVLFTPNHWWVAHKCKWTEQWTLSTKKKFDRISFNEVKWNL